GCASLVRAANDQSRSRPSTHSEARSAAAIDPDRAAAPAPVAVFLATGAGDLLHHHRAALAPVPVAGATALVVAAAGHGVVPVWPPVRPSTQACLDSCRTGAARPRMARVCRGLSGRSRRTGWRLPPLQPPRPSA